jgi:histidinol-phosphate aminotransferase
MLLQVPDYIRTLIPYVPGKPIEETQREFKIKKVIKMASNENPLGPSPLAQKAVAAHLKELHRYPDGGGFRIKQALSKHLQVEPSSLILGNGSNEVIDQLVRTYCVVGDSIVTHQAAFIAYRLCAQIHGVKTLEVPLNAELKFNPVELIALVRKTEKARIVFIANPNNPTGTYLNTTELKSLVKELSTIRGGSVLVALDYAYWEYVTAADLPDASQFLEEYPNVIIMRTFSKVYGLAGLRLGYGIASSEVIADLEKVRQPFNMNSLALAGGEAALSDISFVKKSKALNVQGMKFWEKQLTAAGIPFWPSQGNFILANVAEGLGKTGMEVYQNSLRQGVIFRLVANYGLTHALRISVGTAVENERALEVLVPSKAKSKPRKKK